MMGGSGGGGVDRRKRARCFSKARLLTGGPHSFTARTHGKPYVESTHTPHLERVHCISWVQVAQRVRQLLACKLIKALGELGCVESNRPVVAKVVVVSR